MPSDGLGLGQLRCRNEHPGRCVTGLTGIVVHVHETAGYRGLQVGVLEDDIGGFTTQFLGDALDRRGRVLSDQGARPG